MARSTYIYAVVRPGQEAPVATFTVKHEMRGWLSGQPDHSRAGLAVFRMDDGRGGMIKPMTISDILEGR